MKGLKKIALAAAIASVSLGAQAELQALDDSAMGNVTGQSGVTIELETKVSIGEFVYTDEGSFAVKDIVIGGETVGGGDANKETLNDLALEIDVEDDGDAVIHVTALQSDTLVVGRDANGPVTAEVARPIDFGVATGDMELRANDGTNNSTVLLSNLKLHGDLAALDIRVDTSGDDNLSGVADSLGIAVKFDIDNLDVDVPFMAVGIKGMVITGPDGDPSAVNENGTFPATDYAVVEMDIYKGTAVGAKSTANGGIVTGTDNAGGDALIIDIQNVEMDVFIQDVVVGGTTADAATRSIGSVALNNMVISDTKLAVYGH